MGRRPIATPGHDRRNHLIGREKTKNRFRFHALRRIPPDKRDYRHEGNWPIRLAGQIPMRGLVGTWRPVLPRADRENFPTNRLPRIRAFAERIGLSYKIKSRFPFIGPYLGGGEK